MVIKSVGSNSDSRGSYQIIFNEEKSLDRIIIIFRSQIDFN
jgi:hypothetical protein